MDLTLLRISIQLISAHFSTYKSITLQAMYVLEFVLSTLTKRWLFFQEAVRCRTTSSYYMHVDTQCFSCPVSLWTTNIKSLEERPIFLLQNFICVDCSRLLGWCVYDDDVQCSSSSAPSSEYKLSPTEEVPEPHASSSNDDWQCNSSSVSSPDDK